MKKSIYVFLALVIVSFSVDAQVTRLQANQDESFIKYKLTHPLHEVEAISKKGICIVNADTAAKKIKQTLVEVGVTTFDSGNSNRDSHAMEVINAIKYPGAKFLSSNIVYKGDTLIISGAMTFHGITKNIIFDAVQKWTNNKLEIDGSFKLSLTAYKVDRPTLLIMPVNDDLDFTIKEVFDL
ncbi:MAG: YceI family protein [Ignavibacteriaceae bacterium]